MGLFKDKNTKYHQLIKDLKSLQKDALSADEFEIYTSLDKEIKFVEENLNPEIFNLTDKQYKLFIKGDYKMRQELYEIVLHEDDGLDMMRSYEEEGIYNLSNMFDDVKGDDKFERPSEFLSEDHSPIPENCEADKEENKVRYLIVFLRAMCSMMGFDPLKNFYKDRKENQEKELYKLKNKYKYQLEIDRINRLKNNNLL